MKTCTSCNIEQDEEQFYLHRSARTSEGYRRPICKSCHKNTTVKWQNENSDKVSLIRRRTKLKQKYGISVEEYDAMFKEQNGVCKLCYKEHTRRPLNVDHCHSTGKVRGLLCDKCNMALGLLNDDVKLIDKIKDYLI